MPISVGTVSVDVIPNTQGIYARLKGPLIAAGDKAGSDAGKVAGDRFGAAMAGNVPNSIGTVIGRQIGATIGQQLSSAISSAIVNGVQGGGRQATVTATRTGDDTAGAFARSMKARLEEAFRSMPKLTINIGDTGVDAELARIRARIETLAGKRIGIDIDAADADAQIEAIEADLIRVSTYHPNIAVRADAASALAQLAAVREEIARLSATPGQVRLETDGSFGAKLRAQVAAAQASLPEINVTASTDDASARVAALRAQLTTLANVRVGIDIDAETALTQIAAIRAALLEVAASDATIDVRVDASRAAEELAAVSTEAEALTAKNYRIDVDVNTAGAQGALFALAIQLGILAGIQAGPILAAGIGGIAAAAVSAAVGVGVLAAVAVPAISSIKNVLSLQTAAQQQSTTATNAGAAAAVQAQQKALQLAGAEQALASAQRNGAIQVAQARSQAAQQNAQAAQQVVTAEKDLTTAQQNEVQSQKDLIQARKDAAAQLEDLNNQLTDSQLSQRQAVLAVTDAQATLTADKAAGAKVSAEQLAKDQLAYDQAVQSLKEQQLQTQRLQAQTTAANKAGVSGSATVLSAQQALKQAQQDVLDKTAVLAQAQKAVEKQRVAGAQAVAQAQAQAADSIASAERQIASANLSSASSAGTAQTAQQKYQEALDKLPPSARVLLQAYLNLKKGFLAWSSALDPTVLPLITRAVDGLSGSLGKFTPLVHGAAAGVSTLEDRVGREVKSPFWTGFLHDLTTSVDPAIVGLGTAFGNVFKGIAGIIDAFLPHMTGVSNEMDRITGRFARFGVNLKGSAAFEAFLDYVKRTGPGLAQALGKVFSALLQVSKALAPVSGPVLKIVGSLAQFVGWLAKVNPGLLQGLYLAALAFKALSLGMVLVEAGIAAYNIAVGLATIFTAGWAAAVQATGIVPLIEGIIAVIALLVIGVIYAYNHFTWFRDTVNAVWHAIAASALWLWHDVLQPIWAALVIAFNAVAAAATWLWRNVLVPAFNGIVLAGKILFAVLAVLVFAPLLILFHAVAAVGLWLWHSVLEPAFRGIGAVATWLWHNSIQPAFNGIAVVATWLWRNVFKPYLQAIELEFKALAVVAKWLWKNAIEPAFQGIAAVATWLWKNSIKPAFDGISTVATWLWDKALKPQFDLIKTGVGLVGDAFNSAKNYIAKVWGQVEGIAKKPINFLIKSVYTDGIRAVWDPVAKIVGLKPLPVAPKLLEAGGTIGNGFGPAVPMVTNRPTAIVGEGRSQYPEYVIPTDPKYRSRSLALLHAAGSQMLAGGGIIGTIGGAIKGAAGHVWNAATDGADLLLHPSRIWDKLTAPIKRLISTMGTTTYDQLVERIPLHLLAGAKDAIVKAVGLGGGSGADSNTALPSGGTGVQRWAPQVLQSLQLVNQPASLLQTTLRRMNQESGGDPTIVNRTDSNWIAGTPSVGLMQVIKPTFQHNAGQFRSTGPFEYGVSTNPLANIYASMKYALGRYGSLSSAYDRPGGYDSGGYLPTGLSTVYNGTGRPEPVLTTAQWDAITGKSTTPAGPASFTGDLYLDSGEFLGRVRGEAQQVVNSTLTQVRARSRAGAKGN